ncbi:hypothetical protein MAHJHV65_46950 [Mycobacterium avium subsp. hominissuis]
MTATEPAQRRAPYGANPTLGHNGNRARSEILAAARDLFAEVGYHGVTVEQIAQRAGRSGPSVYQYFENKEEIFRIFVDEIGAELICHAKTMGQLNGPHGLDATRRFVDGVSEIFRKHRVTAIEWPTAEAEGQRLLAPAETFLQRFAAEARPHLGVSTSSRKRDPLRSFPMAMLAIVQWAEFTRQVRAPQLSTRRLNDRLARLFFGVVSPKAAPEESAPTSSAARTASAPMLPLSDHEVPMVGLRRPVTRRSRPTVERILHAASQEFARKGYAGVTIQQIAEYANVGKPNVYTYWTDREALFSTLAHAAAAALQRVLSHDLAAEVLNNADGGRRWLDEWIDLVVHHGAVLHIWTHEMLDDTLGAVAQQMTVFVNDRLNSLLPGPRPRGYDPAPVILWALLVEFPYTLSIQIPELQRAELRELLQLIIHRGLPALRSDTPS